jgi:hypothetical protein
VAIPEDRTLYNDHCEDFKFYNIYFIFQCVSLEYIRTMLDSEIPSLLQELERKECC